MEKYNLESNYVRGAVSIFDKSAPPAISRHCNSNHSKFIKCFNRPNIRKYFYHHVLVLNRRGGPTCVRGGKNEGRHMMFFFSPVAEVVTCLVVNLKLLIIYIHN